MAEKATVRDVIMGLIEVRDGNLYPKRTPDQLQKELQQRSVLDQPYEARQEGDYVRISVEDLHIGDVSTEEEEEAEMMALDAKSIRHTDGYDIKGSVFNTVAAKTSTSVLDTIRDGQYMAGKVSFEFLKSDSDSIETGIRSFTPLAYNLPRSRKGTRVEDGLILVEPNINGFSITVFLEDLDDDSWKELQEIINWITNYQGYLLEKTIRGLNSLGIIPMDLALSQASVGLVPKTRRAWEQKEMRRLGENHRTKEIVENSSNFAKELNEYLDLKPLTASTVRFGVQVFTVQVSSDPAVKKSWTSHRRSLSYFSKADTEGRVERIGGNVRRIPILQEMIPDIESAFWALIPAVLTRFENAARRQLGYSELVQDAGIPESKKAETENVIELFDLDPVEVAALSKSLSKKAWDYLQSRFKEDTVRDVRSFLMEALGNRTVTDSE